MDIEDLREQLETLLASKPDTGAQWAEICRLEQEIVDAEENAAERAWERHCTNYEGPLPLIEQQRQALKFK